MVCTPQGVGNWSAKSLNYKKMKLQNTVISERFLTFHFSDVEDRGQPTLRKA